MFPGYGAFMEYHLAQVNIARWKVDPQSADAATFFAALERVNRLADTSAGFVWRLQTDQGDATSIHVFDDPGLLVNLSVWKSIDALKAYAFRSDHTAIMRRRGEWFERMDQPHLALWWMPANALPTVPEAEQRLVHVREHGPTSEAFTFAKAFPPPNLLH